MDNDNIEIDSVENPSPAVTTAPSRSTSAVTPAVRRTTSTVPRSENHRVRYRVQAVVGFIIMVGLVLFNENRLSGFEAIGLLLFAIALFQFMLAIGLVSELLQQIRDK